MNKIVKLTECIDVEGGGERLGRPSGQQLVHHLTVEPRVHVAGRHVLHLHRQTARPLRGQWYKGNDDGLG